jgi:hypothetical protein
MKKTFLLAILSFVVSAIVAQAPQALNYQAIARNAVGQPIANQNISVKISILDTNGNVGTIQYSELHLVTTNQFGLFTLAIGRPTSTISGTFAGINWSSGSKYIKVEMDPAAGTNYVNMGTTQLQSVPYALNAPDKQTLSWNGGTNTLNISGGNGVVLPISSGSIGPTGPTGVAGAKGATGATGATGAANANGTVNYVPKFTGATALGNSQIFDNGTNVGVGTATTSTKLEVNGVLTVSGSATNSATDLGPGKYSKDNAVLAWGLIKDDATFTLSSTHNVSRVVKGSAGNYFIELKQGLVNGSYLGIVVTPEIDTPPTNAATHRFAFVNAIAGSLSFYVFMSDGNFTPVDNDFSFIVTGK